MIGLRTRLIRRHGVGGYVGGLLPMGTPTTLTGPGIDDATHVGQPIGFAFDFAGTTYTDFSVSTNGWLGLMPGGAAPANWDYNNSVVNSVAPPDDALAVGILPWWDDLRTAFISVPFPAGGYLRYETQGVAPDRRLVVDWLCHGLYGQTAVLAVVMPFQLVLYETSFDIEFRYDDYTVIGTIGALVTGAASCGARGACTAHPFPPGEARGFFGSGAPLGGGDTTFRTDIRPYRDVPPPPSEWPGTPTNTLGFAYDFSFNLPGAPPGPDPKKRRRRTKMNIPQSVTYVALGTSVGLSWAPTDPLPGDVVLDNNTVDVVPGTPMKRLYGPIMEAAQYTDCKLEYNGDISLASVVILKIWSSNDRVLWNEEQTVNITGVATRQAEFQEDALFGRFLRVSIEQGAVGDTADGYALLHCRI